MPFKDSHQGLGVDVGLGMKATGKRPIPLFPTLIGLLAATNVASVVFVLMS